MFSIKHAIINQINQIIFIIADILKIYYLIKYILHQHIIRLTLILLHNTSCVIYHHLPISKKKILLGGGYQVIT